MPVIKLKDPKAFLKKTKAGVPAFGPNSLVPFKTVILLGLS